MDPVKTCRNRQIGVGKRPFYGVKTEATLTWRPVLNWTADREGPPEGRDERRKAGKRPQNRPGAPFDPLDQLEAVRAVRGLLGGGRGARASMNASSQGTTGRLDIIHGLLVPVNFSLG